MPSPRFFLDFSPSFRTSIADVYYLNMVQYYGEHHEEAAELDSLKAMVDLVTSAESRVHDGRTYFGAFALLDAGEG